MWHSMKAVTPALQGERTDAIVVSMGGNPSSRSQTLLLATWLSDLMQQCSISAETEITHMAVNPTSSPGLSLQQDSAGIGLADSQQQSGYMQPSGANESSRERLAADHGKGVLGPDVPMHGGASNTGRACHLSSPQRSPQHLRLPEVSSMLWQGRPSGRVPHANSIKKEKRTSLHRWAWLMGTLDRPMASWPANSITLLPMVVQLSLLQCYCCVGPTCAVNLANSSMLMGQVAAGYLYQVRMHSFTRTS